MKHKPMVIERRDWRITKAACSCGAELQLAGDVGSVREQFQKLVAAFQKHMIQKETARQKPEQYFNLEYREEDRKFLRRCGIEGLDLMPYQVLSTAQSGDSYDQLLEALKATQTPPTPQYRASSSNNPNRPTQTQTPHSVTPTPVVSVPRGLFGFDRAVT